MLAMNLFDKPFQNVNLLGKAMNASWVKHEAISNNIANVNTPRYKRNVVQFESLLQESLNGTTVRGNLTHPKHIPLGAQSIEDIQPVVMKDLSTRSRLDGNNVDIDVEMGNLAKNTIQYQVLAQRVSDYFNKLKTVIRDGR